MKKVLGIQYYSSIIVVVIENYKKSEIKDS